MINKQIELGVINRLRIDRFAAPGCYLMAEDGSDVLLPNQYINDDMQLDDVLEVFIYTDSEDRLVATTQRPYALRDEFGFFEVLDVTAFGAFVDWGLPKDLFVPKNRQRTPMKVGEKRFLRVVKDARSERLVGVEKISKYLQQPKKLRTNDPATFLIIAQTPMGYKCIVNNRFEGMLYANEIFEPIAIGDTKQGYIKQLRNDGQVDGSLQLVGAKRTSDDREKIIAQLKSNGGMLPYNYKSDPESIKAAFQMSRKAFKRTLTELIEKNLIRVDETGIYLIKGA